MRKFVLEEGWVPKKLGKSLPRFISLQIFKNYLWWYLQLASPVDVYIDVPDTIDISFMRSKGLQSGEELLPDAGKLSLLISSSSFLILKVKYMEIGIFSR